MAQCTAHSKRHGGQCGRPAILGGTVCYIHGGAAPQTKAAALRRILALVDPALEALSEALDDPSAAIRVSAAKDLLDRAGLKPALVIAGDLENPLHVDISAREQVEAGIARILARSGAQEDPGRPE